MPNIKKIIDYSLPRTKEMIPALLSDLFIAKVYYLIDEGDERRVYQHQIRSRVKRLNKYGKDETEEEYEEYKEYLKTMVEKEQILIIKQ